MSDDIKVKPWAKAVLIGGLVLLVLAPIVIFWWWALFGLSSAVLIASAVTWVVCIAVLWGFVWIVGVGLAEIRRAKEKAERLEREQQREREHQERMSQIMKDMA